ncbi:MAG: hypothetical protein ACYDBQ_08145 [Thermoplasmatota archaeon]
MTKSPCSSLFVTASKTTLLPCGQKSPSRRFPSNRSVGWSASPTRMTVLRAFALGWRQQIPAADAGGAASGVAAMHPAGDRAGDDTTRATGAMVGGARVEGHGEPVGQAAGCAQPAKISITAPATKNRKGKATLPCCSNLDG